MFGRLTYTDHCPYCTDRSFKARIYSVNLQPTVIILTQFKVLTLKFSNKPQGFSQSWGNFSLIFIQALSNETAISAYPEQYL